MTQKNKKSSIIKQKSSFTIIPNKLINNGRISLKAKGLYCYLFSKPDNWEFYQKNIIKDLKEGRDAFDNAIKELETFGWLERIRKKGDDGKFKNYDYYLKNEVLDNKKTSAGFPNVVNPNAVNPYDKYNNTYKLNNTYNIKEDENFIFFKEIIKKYKEPQKLRDETIEKLYPSLKNKFSKCLKTIGSKEEMEKQVEEYSDFILTENFRAKAGFEVWINQPAKYLENWLEKKNEFLKRQKAYNNKNPQKVNEKEKILDELKRKGF